MCMHACRFMCMPACRSMCMCVLEWKPEEGQWVSCIITLTPRRQSLTECGSCPPPNPPVSSCPPPTPTPSAVVMMYAVMSGCWETELRSSSLGSKRSYPWSHFSNSFFYQILMHSGVHIRLFSISFLKLILLTNL